MLDKVIKHLFKIIALEMMEILFFSSFAVKGSCSITFQSETWNGLSLVQFCRFSYTRTALQKCCTFDKKWSLNALLKDITGKDVMRKKIKYFI